MDLEIISPPFPGLGLTDEQLYEKIKELRAFILHYREGLNAAVSEEVIVRPINMAKEAIWTMQPVFYKYRVFRFMRWLRETWDAIIRNYEDVWDSRMSVQSQLYVLATAAKFFNDIFTPFEVREMREEEEIAAYKEMQEDFEQTMKTMMDKFRNKRGEAKQKKKKPGES